MNWPLFWSIGFLVVFIIVIIIGATVLKDTSYSTPMIILPAVFAFFDVCYIISLLKDGK